MKKNILKVSSALMCAAVAGSSAVAPIMSNVSAKSTTSVDAMSIVADSEDAITFDSKKSECPFLVSVKQNDLGGSATVKPGDKIKYDVTIRNTSDKNVSGMVMYMALPDGVKYVSSDITQDNGADRFDSFKSMVSWGKGEGLLTIKPAAKYEDKSPTIDAGDTMSFELIGEVTDSVEGSDIKTNLEVHYKGADGKSVSVNSADIVTKVTSLKNCIITLNSNGGKAINAVTVKEGKGVDSLPATVRDGYTFDGWFTAADGGDKVTAIDKVTNDVMLYAHWTANTYQVTFDAQGGNEIAPMSVRADEVVTDLPTPERTDYAFDGWYTKADGGKKVTELSTVKDVTLYAHWKLSHYTLTFDSQGGTEVQPITENIETPFTSMPITTKTNYVFTGWYTKPEGGIRVTSVTDGKSMKLYAHWSEATYVLTFNANGGDSVPAIRFAATEGVPADKMPVPVRDGYTFNGWFTATEGGDKVESYMTTADATLYAQWTKNDTTKPDDGSTSKPDDGSGSTDAKDDGSSDSKDDKSDAEVRTYKLTVISADGTTTNVSVKSSVTLDALVQKLGYTNAKTYKMTTASGSGTDLAADTTMKDIADAAADGEVLVIAYDESGKAIGSGKVTSTGTDTFNVSLSKDTNVSLDKGTGTDDKAGVDGKGVGESDTPAKSDSTVAAVKTADVGVVPALGGMGGVMSTLLGVLAIFKRKH